MSRSRSPVDHRSNAKVFVTNIDAKQPQEEAEGDLRKLFEKYGMIKELKVKKSKNGYYNFAFAEFAKPQEAGKAVKQLDQHELQGRKIRVEHWVAHRPRERQVEVCYNCDRSGHYARECPELQRRRNGESRQRRRGSRENGRDDKREKQRQYRDSEKRRRSRSRSNHKRHEKGEKNGHKYKERNRDSSSRSRENGKRKYYQRHEQNKKRRDYN